MRRADSRHSSAPPQRLARAAVLVLACAGCARAPEAARTEVSALREDCSDRPAPAKTERVSIQYAKNFRVEYRDDAKVVHVSRPWRGSDATFTYYLVHCGEPPPPDAAGAVTVEIPPRRVATTSTTQLPHLVALDLLDRLAGHNRLDFIYEPEVRALVDAGRLTDIGDGVRLNREVLVALQPDLVFASSIGGSELDHLGLLREQGLATVVDAAWMEATPLGRSEWLKFTALFFDREEEANRIFADISARYEQTRRLAATARDRPSVLVGTPFEGTWHVSGGGAYQARLIADAGGRYLWEDDTSQGAIPLDFESVYAVGLDADVWLHPYGWTSLAQARRSEPRMADFRAFREGRVYNNDRRMNAAGGNDYWESGSLRADLVLEDLVRIFHPALLPEHELVYHRVLPPG